MPIDARIVEVAKDITVAAVNNPNYFHPSMTAETRVNMVCELYKNVLDTILDNLEKPESTEK